MTSFTKDSGDQLPANRTGSRVFIIYLKEVRETFRDKRTVMSVIISPLLLTPLMFAGLGLVIASQAQKTKTKQLSVGIMGGDRAPSIVAGLQTVSNLKFKTVFASDAEALIRDRKLNTVAIIPQNYEQMNSGFRPATIQIMLDDGDENSHTAAGRLHEAFAKLSEQVVQRRLMERSLSADFARPFRISDKPIKSGGSEGTMFLAMMLPYTLVISAFGGAIYSALDQVAGEKERGTLETLLVSPASRRDIVLGKFAAVVTTCIVSSVLSIVGMIITFSMPGRAFAWISQGGLHLSTVAIVVTFLVILPLAFVFAGLLLAVSTFARNQKEAQTYLAPLFLIVLMPAMLSMFMGTDVSRQLGVVPVLGTAIIIKQALSGNYDPVFIGLAFGASVAYAGIALAFAVHLFHKESVLIKA